MAGRPIRIAILANGKQAIAEMEKTSRSATKMGAGIDRVGAGIGKGLATAAKVGFGAVTLAAAGAAAGLAKAGMAAVEMNDTIDATKVIFGEASDAVLKFADSSAQSIGLSKQAALTAAGTIGTFGKVAGLSGGKLSDFTTGLVQLGGDLASFKGGTATEAIDAIASALQGEAEPIRKYGVLLDEASIKAEGLRLGLLKGAVDMGKVKAAQVGLITAQQNLNKVNADPKATAEDRQKATLKFSIAQGKLKAATAGTIGTLTAQQKVLATQSLILAQTTDAQGDNIRTGNSAKNQMERFKASAADLSAQLGAALVPALGAVAGVANKKLVPAFRDLIKKVGPSLEGIATKAATGLADGITGVIGAAKRYGPGISAALSSGLATLKGAGAGDLFKQLQDNAKNLVPAIEPLVTILKALVPTFVDLAKFSADLARIYLPLLLKALQFVADHAEAFALAVKIGIPLLVGLRIAMVGVNAVMAVNLLRLKAATVGTMEYAVITRTVAAATKVWTAVQAAFNFVFIANPIGLVVLAIIALVAIIYVIATRTRWFQELWHLAMQGMTAAIHGIVAAAGAVMGWLSAHWPLILAIITGPLGLIVLAVSRNWGLIMGFFKAIPGQIAAAARGMWDPIANGFKAAINVIIRAWNRLELAIPSIDTGIPGVGDIGGFTLRTKHINELAAGGIVTRPTLALIGEAGPEAVIPLDRMGGGGNVYQITNYVAPGADPAEAGRQTVAAIEAHERRSGRRRLMPA